MKLDYLKKLKPSPPAPLTKEPVMAIKTIPVVAKEGSLQDLIAPSAIEVDFDYLKINNFFVRTLFVAGFPRYVNANWLSPLINFDHSLDISLFIYPVESKSVLDDLRRKIAEMEAEIATDIERGRVINPATRAKLEDAHVMQEQLVKGEERFFQFGLYVTIPAETLEELNNVSREVESTLASLLITPKHATLQMEEGFKSTLPLCLDYLNITRNMDTTSLATTFPFASSELTANEGVLYGINEHNGSLIVFDRFTMENYNACLFAKAGAGKCTARWVKTLIVDEKNQVNLEDIGSIVEKQISLHGKTKIDEETEGVINPNLKVLTFDQNLKATWSNIIVAARKKFSPRNRLYLITTKSGRQITVTADHNLIILRKGKIRVMRSEAIKIGEAVPLSRNFPLPTNQLHEVSPSSIYPQWPTSLPLTLPLNFNLLTLLGFVTSEGLIRPKFLRIFNTDPQINLLTEKCAHALDLKTFKITKNSKEIGRGISPNHFAKFFISLGAGGNSGEKRIPPIIFSLSNEQIAHYLRAYFEGDGGIEHDSINATTKSKDLASDLAYILLRFSIIARLRPKQKSATNAVNQTKNTYYQITISGQDNLVKFAKNIGFLSVNKKLQLRHLLTKSTAANTNVDTIPSLQPIYNYLYKSLFSSTEIPSPPNLSDLKRSHFNPSPQQLKKFIQACEKRLSELRSLRYQIQLLSKIPSLTTIIRRGSQNRRLNRQLWGALGVSWNNMKQLLHPPLAKNVLLAYQTITNQNLTLPEINKCLYSSFKSQGVSLCQYNQALWHSIVRRKTGNCHFSTIFEAAQFIARRYRSTQLKIRHAEEKLAQLKLLANSDLFWDPITKIEKVKHKEKYVYDLQVDNGVFLAGHGGLFVHNSYLVKLEILRSLMFDAEIIVIDPENEYENLCRAVAGEYITFGFNSQAKINPFDLSQIVEEGENELNNKVLSLHSLFKVIMGDLNSGEEATLDRALMSTYQLKGITQDPSTQTKPPPLMKDLYQTLSNTNDPIALSLANRIEKFIKGSFAGIFDQPSNVNIRNPFTVFSLRDIEATLRPITMFIVLDFIWTKIRKDLKKRILVVDEAWFMMRHPDSANYLNSIAKRARKYYLGVTTITQDVEDFLKDDLGKAIVTNSSIQVLMKQHPAAMEKISQVFYLSEGEKQFLLACDIGEGLFFAGNNHVAIKVVASPEEHQLVTSKPEELLAQKRARTPPSPSSLTPPPTQASTPIPPTSPSIKTPSLVTPRPSPPVSSPSRFSPPPTSSTPLPPRFKSEIIIDNKNGPADLSTSKD